MSEQEMWNKRLERDNITEFYNETIDMVYPSVYSVCKETTRTEQAIVKSYVDVFQQRQNIPGEEVLYVFGDILLKNANDIVEKYELPEGLTFGERSLDEYTRNSMLEKINSKIDSKGFKVAEFISSDAKKVKAGASYKSTGFSLVVTPLLIFHMVVLALLIWGISYAAITLPYRHNELISDDVNESVPLMEKYVSVLDYFPLNPNFSSGQQATTDESTEESEELAPSFETTEPVATKG